MLIVDDEQQIRKLLTVSLESYGFQTDAVGQGAEGVEKVAKNRYDLVLLDLGLPDMDGLTVCERLREFSDVPVIVISVRDDEQAMVRALDLGADDYVTKPFSMGELLARIRANLRRSGSGGSEPVIEIGDVVVDLPRREVTRGGQAIHLTPSEYELLRVLAIHRGKVLTHRQLLREARGPAYEEDRPLLRVHLVGLRKKLGISAGQPGYIATEARIGYRLLDQGPPA